MYEINKNDIEGKTFLNISSKTPGKVGRKLAYTSTFNAVNTLIGKITSLRPAMDYIITPNYPVRLLSKNNLTAKDIAKIPNKTIGVINYWAIVTHLVFERIYQDKLLLESLLELNENINFTSFDVKKNHGSGLNSNVTSYNKNTVKYVEIIGKIFNLLHTYKGVDLENAVKDLIYETKEDKNASLFHGVPFDIEFDDTQLKAS